MKNFYALCFFLCLGFACLAQSPCDSVNIVSVSYDAMRLDTLNVVVNNQSSVSFQYPSFVLLGANEDTLARQSGYFFGLGSYNQGLTLAQEQAFNGNIINGAKLLLYTGFDDSLACTFTEDIDLCSDSCSEMLVTIQSTGPVDSTETINVTILDSLSNVVYFEAFLLDSIEFFLYDTVCLAPGDYTVEFDQVNPNAATVFFGLNPHYFYAGVNGNTAENNTTQTFTVWERCWKPDSISQPNAVPEVDGATQHLNLRVINGQIHMSGAQNAMIQHTTLYDISGRMVLDRSVNKGAAIIGVEHLQHGIYIVKTQVNGRWVSQRIWL